MKKLIDLYEETYCDGCPNRELVVKQRREFVDGELKETDVYSECVDADYCRRLYEHLKTKAKNDI